MLDALRQRHFKPTFTAILRAKHLAIACRDVDLLGVVVMQPDRLAQTTPETPSKRPMHPSQQPPNTESNYSGRIWLCFDGVAEPLVERCGSISGGVGGLSV